MGAILGFDDAGNQVGVTPVNTVTAGNPGNTLSTGVNAVEGMIVPDVDGSAWICTTSYDSVGPVNAVWVHLTSGSGSGLTPVTLTYNGGAAYTIDAIVPIGWDPTVGGTILYADDGTGPIATAWAAAEPCIVIVNCDGTGNVAQYNVTVIDGQGDIYGGGETGFLGLSAHDPLAITPGTVTITIDPTQILFADSGGQFNLLQSDGILTALSDQSESVIVLGAIHSDGIIQIENAAAGNLVATLESIPIGTGGRLLVSSNDGTKTATVAADNAGASVTVVGDAGNAASIETDGGITAAQGVTTGTVDTVTTAALGAGVPYQQGQAYDVMAQIIGTSTAGLGQIEVLISPDGVTYTSLGTFIAQNNVAGPGGANIACGTFLLRKGWFVKLNVIGDITASSIITY